MSHPASRSDVAANEWLARFILFSKWIRGSDSTIRPDAFIPHPWPDLSVTRHKDISVQELWRIGQRVADDRPATLYGRADFTTEEVNRQKLDVQPRPIPGNRNHACIVGWPGDKPAQKILAQELAAVARYVPAPGGSSTTTHP